jgi:hypothetical protein
LLALTKAKLLNIPVTNLLAVISQGSDELYTKDTCQEFHQLLRMLLTLFHHSLMELKSLVNPVQSVFDGAVQKVVCYGEALQTMAGGVAIQRHFQVIEDELSILHHKRTRDVANQTATLLPTVETKQEHDHDVKLQSV